MYLLSCAINMLLWVLYALLVLRDIRINNKLIIQLMIIPSYSLILFFIHSFIEFRDVNYILLSKYFIVFFAIKTTYI